MKQFLLVGIASLVCSFTIKEPLQQSQAQAQYAYTLQQNDKAFLLDYYHGTAEKLKKSIEGLSEAQLQFKPSANEWSVSQCVEHIILTEKMLFDMTKEALKKPANPERKEEVKVTDQQLLDGITDRSYKAEASAELIGEGRYADPTTALRDLQAQRAEILAFIENVPIEELRNHISDSPFGPVDAYHSLLFIAGHTARHTLQIEEVKAKDGFPKE